VFGCEVGDDLVGIEPDYDCTIGTTGNNGTLAMHTQSESYSTFSHPTQNIQRQYAKFIGR
jgi:hypothetical protein